jgi:hypothetical protein
MLENELFSHMKFGPIECTDENILDLAERLRQEFETLRMTQVCRNFIVSRKRRNGIHVTHVWLTDGESTFTIPWPVPRKENGA